jgi:hypothetical protein
MMSKLFKSSRSLAVISLLALVLFGLSACDSEPPALMKASKQFDSDEIRDKHVAHMRKYHMVELLHKRDETVYKGIRTEKHSLNACINCHVPETHNGEVLRHTNPEHFCSTCHGYVAAQLDCFQCHVDHPVKDNAMTSVAPSDQIHQQLSKPQKTEEQVTTSDIKLAANNVKQESKAKGESDSE